MGSFERPADKIAVRARIRGQVQGVFYRGWTETQATQMGIHGWVRNRLDGTVEALFIGAQADVDDMVMACLDGPRGARVDGVETKDAMGIAPSRFEIKPTV